MLPPGWAIAVRPGDGSAGARTDAYVDVTAPSGERTSACVEFKARAEPAEVVRLVPWLQQCGAAILVAPVIGSRAREILADAGVSWMEPDGDCRIALGNLFVERLGRRRARREADAAGTRFVADLFSGAALRVVRWLLIDPGRHWTLQEMAWETGLSKGFVSRTFKTLARDAYLSRARGASYVADREGLLGAWVAAPGPSTPIEERVALADSAEAVLRAIRAATDLGSYAITAEAAADRLAPYARFSRVEAYVEDAAAWDKVLNLTPVPRGGNVILLASPDRGVFDGVEARDGLMVVSRPQLYVDLVRRGGAGG
ncbi:MAG: hypothetical protein ACYDAN_13265, partial [Candidatus Limnocylindrales bacterium]